MGSVEFLKKMTAKRYFSYLYGGHRENVSHIQLNVIIIGFLDPENIGIDTNVVFLSSLQVKTSPETQFNDCCVAIWFLPS